MAKTHYCSEQLPQSEIRKIVKGKDWIHFCENHRGECYWNQATGEIAWLSNKEMESNIQRLVK